MRTQLKNRGLNPLVASYYRGKIYRREIRQGERNDLTSGPSDRRLPAAERLAAGCGVDERTLRRDKDFSIMLDKLPELLDSVVLAPVPVKVTRGDVIKLARMDPDEIHHKVQQLLKDGKLPKPAQNKPTRFQALRKMWEKAEDEDKRALLTHLLMDEKTSQLIRELAAGLGVSAGQGGQESAQEPQRENEDLDDAVQPTHEIEEPAEEPDKTDVQEDEDDPAPLRRRPK